jgi:hypothetical protein
MAIAAPLLALTLPAWAGSGSIEDVLKEGEVIFKTDHGVAAKYKNVIHFVVYLKGDLKNVIDIATSGDGTNARTSYAIQARENGKAWSLPASYRLGGRFSDPSNHYPLQALLCEMPNLKAAAALFFADLKLHLFEEKIEGLGNQGKSASLSPLLQACEELIPEVRIFPWEIPVKEAKELDAMNTRLGQVFLSLGNDVMAANLETFLKDSTVDYLPGVSPRKSLMKTNYLPGFTLGFPYLELASSSNYSLEIPLGASSMVFPSRNGGLRITLDKGQGYFRFDLQKNAWQFVSTGGTIIDLSMYLSKLPSSPDEYGKIQKQVQDALQECESKIDRIRSGINRSAGAGDSINRNLLFSQFRYENCQYWLHVFKKAMEDMKANPAQGR